MKTRKKRFENQVGFGDITVVAPEALLGCTWDCTADLWSVGATVSQFVYDVANHFQIYEMITGIALNELGFSRKSDQDKTILQDLVCIFGPVPEYMKNEGRRVKHFFNDEGILLLYKILILTGNIPGDPFSQSLDSLLLMYIPDLPGSVCNDIIHFLRKMLQMDPSTVPLLMRFFPRMDTKQSQHVKSKNSSAENHRDSNAARRKMSTRLYEKVARLKGHQMTGFVGCHEQ